jgi:hypothetical protein
MKTILLLVFLSTVSAEAADYWVAEVEVDRGNEKSTQYFTTKDLRTEIKSSEIKVGDKDLSCTLDIQIPFGNIAGAAVYCTDTTPVTHRFEILASCLGQANSMFISSYKKKKYVEGFTIKVSCSQKST